MSKGILLGLLMQCISAVGYLVIVNVNSIKSEWFRTGLMICFAGIVALIVTGYTVFAGHQQLSSLGLYELFGFALMVAGYVVFLSKPLPQ